MKSCSFTCALALAAIMFFAGNANAHTLDAEGVQKLLEHPAMVNNDELSLIATEQAQQIETMIELVFAPLETAIPGAVSTVKQIGLCESGLNHIWNESDPRAGTLIENSDPDSSAAGVLQVLLKTHRSDYQRIGLDPRNAADNIVFSRVLVERKLRAGRPPFEDWECA